MLVEENNRCKSLNAQKMFGTLPLDQFGEEEVVRNVLKVGAVVRIKKEQVSCTR